jgi:chromosome segregation ATPase
MANGANFNALLSKLDAQQRGLSTAINNAKTEVAAAQQAVTDLESAISRQTQSIGQIKHELQVAPSEPPTLRAQIETRLQAAQAQQDQSTKQLDQARAQLTSVLAARKEEAARRSLEQAHADFLVETKMLLASSHDMAVHYLLAGAVLDALRTRNIGVDAFSSLADKQTVSDIVISLNAVRDGTAEADRQEAARFEELRRLTNGVTNSQSEFLATVKDAQKKSADLAAQCDDLRKQIAELQAALAASEAERNKRGSGLFARIGNAFSAVGDKLRDMKLSSRTSDLDSTIKNRTSSKLRGRAARRRRRRAQSNMPMASRRSNSGLRSRLAP